MIELLIILIPILSPITFHLVVTRWLGEPVGKHTVRAPQAISVAALTGRVALP